MTTGLSELLLALAIALSGQLESAKPEPIRFSWPVAEAAGQVKGSAEVVDVQEGQVVLSGDVELVYKSVVVRADRLELDLAAGSLRAVGNVIFDQGPKRLTGATLSYDLEARTGELTDATAVVDPDYYFSGAVIAMEEEGLYRVEDGVFTSCTGEVPGWSFRIGHGRIREEAYARIRNVTMRAGRLPIFYFPYVIWPTKTERTSGFLFPNFGHSSDRGAYLGLEYYQVLGRSADLTLATDWYSEEYLGLGTELRYQPTDDTKGTFRAYAIDDPVADEWRWKVLLDHETRNLPGGLRGVVHFEDYSDFEFFRDFERGLDKKAQRDLYSSGYLSGNWGNQSFNLLLDQRETFLTNDSIVALRQLPEVEYSVRPTRLGNTALFFDLDSSLHYFSVDRPSRYQGEYGRAHLFPNLSASLTDLPWLGVSVSAGGQMTWWSDSLGESGDGSGFSGDSLSRFLPSAGVRIVGPSLSRVFEGGFASFGKIKHLIEPQIRYSYGQEFDQQAEVPLFDQIDSVFGSQEASFTLTNRFYGKPADPEGGDSREILSLELSRRVSLDDQVFLESGTVRHELPDGSVQSERLTSKAGPLDLVLRSYPSEHFDLRITARYSVLFSNLTSTLLSGGYRNGPFRVALTWAPSFEKVTGETVNNQATLSVTTPIVPGKLKLDSYVSYDFQRSLLRDQRHFLTYTGNCATLRFEMHQSQTGSERRRDFVFAVDLKNVGTFFDFNAGQTDTF